MAWHLERKRRGPVWEASCIWAIKSHRWRLDLRMNRSASLMTCDWMTGLLPSTKFAVVTLDYVVHKYEYFLCTMLGQNIFSNWSWHHISSCIYVRTSASMLSIFRNLCGCNKFSHAMSAEDKFRGKWPNMKNNTSRNRLRFPRFTSNERNPISIF